MPALCNIKIAFSGDNNTAKMHIPLSNFLVLSPASVICYENSCHNLIGGSGWRLIGAVRNWLHLVEKKLIGKGEREI
jgi:hypothetical protein